MFLPSSSLRALKALKMSKPVNQGITGPYTGIKAIANASNQMQPAAVNPSQPVSGGMQPTQMQPAQMQPAQMQSGGMQPNIQPVAGMQDTSMLPQNGLPAFNDPTQTETARQEYNQAYHQSLYRPMPNQAQQLPQPAVAPAGMGAYTPMYQQGAIDYRNAMPKPQVVSNGNPYAPLFNNTSFKNMNNWSSQNNPFTGFGTLFRY